VLDTFSQLAPTTRPTIIRAIYHISGKTTTFSFAAHIDREIARKGIESKRERCELTRWIQDQKRFRDSVQLSALLSFLHCHK